MSDVVEKRVYGDAAGDRTAFVAGGRGVVAVRVSAGHVGRFGLVDDRAARDAAAAPPGTAWPPVAVAGTDDVRLGDADGLAAAGFGPAVAVGFAGDALLAAGPDGRVARAGPPEGWPEDAHDPATVEWTTIGTVADVRAVDGPLVATADGVVRVRDGDLAPAGLTDARDVAATGPLAATGDGLYRLGNGWQDVLDGAVRFVAAEAGGRQRAHAGVDGDRAGADEAVWTRHDGEWTTAGLPAVVADETVVDAGYGTGTYAVTDEGTLLAAGGPDGDTATADGGAAHGAGGDWRTHSLGVRNVAALAVAGAANRP